MPEVLIKKYGITTAAVWGSMWLFCQMKDNVCKATVDKIASRAGISRQAATPHIQALANDGYFVDTTPNLRNKPHIYKDTGKITFSNTFEIGVNQVDSGVKEVDSQSKEALHEYKENKQVNKPKIKEVAQAPKPLKANQIPQVILFREVTTKYPSKGSQFTVITSVDKAGDRLGREAIADDLLPFYREWCDRGYNPMAVKWLEWAVSGEIPQRTNGNRLTQDRDAILLEVARG